ncbi:MAG TPA: hypothetical protein DDW49_11520 [Deltaproteobacteria bacterium]|nr:MAG: hypothetical protein A2048_05785 [Deltaproteobacteria bacterium GWA2_45_12]HBF13996.1 hypothetical protein [Deltaproteobacteria bacterium]
MKRLFYFIFMGLMALNTACSSSGTSSSSDDSDDSSGVALVSELPSATSPVTDGADASMSALMVKALGDSTTGMPLGTIDSDDFDSDSSQAACEAFNMSKTAISEAARGDLILCYITTTFDAFANTEGIDIYDGEYHVFDLDFAGSSFDEGEDAGGPSKIKFKVVKDSSGAVTNFEMFACGDSGDENEQSMYISQTISGTTFAMEALNIGSQGSQTYRDSIEVSGTLVDGEFVDELNGVATPKVIHMQHVFADEENGSDFYGDITFNQSSDSATITGFMSGAGSHDGESCSFTNNLYATLGLNDTNSGDDYSIGLLEVGDGAAKNGYVSQCGEGDENTGTALEAWDGTTATEVDPTESDYYTEANAATLGEDAEEPTIAFAGDQTVDCENEEVEATVVFADIEEGGIDIAGTCSNLELGHNHIECYQITGGEGD